ncbi:TonB-dependent receptor plug domain-containing protein [Telmatospirillum sp.]|uniref:TonB-dependent receptor plug domain-containing protein n=1 Tax=Telmatospirillum sp. TaxID=2079197 RepID=UPI002841F085|nr:TonB-dependent receptor plug domain-containing protein [Telmatospirillum sp.]MDR3435196.1 TonB-dependent receptor plug domain-containing protein [Telmatospirillum sp.]
MKRMLFAAVSLFSLPLAVSVSAQEFDYGNYEALFGEPVTVSATGKPERVADSPVLMDLITAEDIRRSGARDIPTLVHRLAGVDLAHSAAGVADVGIGGYIQPLVSRVMVLINGRQVYFDAFGDVFWTTLPVELEEIRQIEVIRGPQSALYGFNAVDGVINIVTFDPVDDPIDAARVRVGNHGRRDEAATTTQRLADGVGVRMTAANDHVDDYGMVSKVPVNTAYSKDPNRRSVSFDAAAKLSDASRLSLEASHTDVSQRQIYSNLFFDLRIKTEAVKGGYSADTGIGRLSATASYSDVDMPWVQAQPFGAFHLNDRTAELQASDLFKLGADDSFRVGLDGRQGKIDAPGVLSGTLTGNLAAGSLMWEHQLSSELSTVNAVRYDYFKLGRSGSSPAYDIFTNADFDRSNQGVSVNSSLLDQVAEDDKLRLSFSRGLKLPSLANFGELGRYQASYSGLYFFGNPDLRASAVYGYQAGWDHQFRDLGATARMTVFHDMTMSHIGTVYKQVGNSLAQLIEMTTGSVTNGLELGLEHKAREGWNWGGNYTYQRLHEHHDWGLRNATPVNKLNANIGYGWGEWEADLYGSYTSATKGMLITSTVPLRSQVVEIKGFTTLSPRIAWRPIEPLSIELTAENLWPYQDTVPQKMETSYYLTVKVSY